MSTRDTGGPAFPTLERSYEDSRSENTIHVTEGGMTLRDYYAGKAMEAYISSASSDLEMMRAVVKLAQSKGMVPEDYIATESYTMADAMLRARKEPA